MIKIGLTGGIGSGKTVVANLFDVMGIPVYIADDESKRLTDSDPYIRNQLIALFGTTIYHAHGLNRPLLASHIFSNKELLQRVNAIIHPCVNRHFKDWANRQTTSFCVIETAILFESGFNNIVDVSLMISAPLSVRIDRVLSRNPDFSREETEKRISSQMPDEEKIRLSDYVIYNDNSHALIPQLHTFLDTFRE